MGELKSTESTSRNFCHGSARVMSQGNDFIGDDDHVTSQVGPSFTIVFAVAPTATWSLTKQLLQGHPDLMPASLKNFESFGLLLQLADKFPRSFRRCFGFRSKWQHRHSHVRSRLDCDFRSRHSDVAPLPAKAASSFRCGTAISWQIPSGRSCWQR